MRWSSKIPTKPGYYWWRLDKTVTKHLNWYIEYLPIRDGKLFNYKTWDAPRAGQWAGPFELPLK